MYSKRRNQGSKSTFDIHSNKALSSLIGIDIERERLINNSLSFQVFDFHLVRVGDEYDDWTAENFNTIFKYVNLVRTFSKFSKNKIQIIPFKYKKCNQNDLLPIHSGV